MKPSGLKAMALAVINLVSHIPFLFAGYGREEDAWAQALNAKTIYTTGVYEVSRLPGHPLYELLLTLLWPLNHTYFFFNLLTTLASTLAVISFYRICRKLHCPHPFLLSLILSFIPVFFIAGTYTIDYNFALLFILLSFEQLISVGPNSAVAGPGSSESRLTRSLKAMPSSTNEHVEGEHKEAHKLYRQPLISKRLLLSGIFIGIAAGFRISSLFLLLPWLVMMKGFSTGNFFRLCIPAGIIAIIAYLPPLFTYGTGFLDFHKPPYPAWENVVYKLSFGIWGTILLLYLGISLVFRLVGKNSFNWKFDQIRNFKLGVFLILILQLLVFFRLPFKSEFLIPALPFLLIILSRIFNGLQLKLLAITSILSCFLVGFDYKSTERGSPPSPLHLTFDAGGKVIYFDLLQGPVIIDHRKRLVKYDFVSDVIGWMKDQRKPVYLVSGWYYPQIVLRSDSDHPVELDYLAEKEDLIKAHENGYTIYYLPEINEATARVRGHNLTDSLGHLLSFE